jgi:hypothetical protein
MKRIEKLKIVRQIEVANSELRELRDGLDTMERMKVKAKIAKLKTKATGLNFEPNYIGDELTIAGVAALKSISKIIPKSQKEELSKEISSYGNTDVARKVIKVKAIIDSMKVATPADKTAYGAAFNDIAYLHYKESSYSGRYITKKGVGTGSKQAFGATVFNDLVDLEYIDLSEMYGELDLDWVPKTLGQATGKSSEEKTEDEIRSESADEHMKSELDKIEAARKELEQFAKSNNLEFDDSAFSTGNVRFLWAGEFNHSIEAKSVNIADVIYGGDVRFNINNLENQARITFFTASSVDDIKDGILNAFKTTGGQIKSNKKDIPVNTPKEKETGFAGTDTDRLVKSLEGLGLSVQRSIFGEGVFTKIDGVDFEFTPKGGAQYEMKVGGIAKGLKSFDEVMSYVSGDDSDSGKEELPENVKRVIAREIQEIQTIDASLQNAIDIRGTNSIAGMDVFNDRKERLGQSLKKIKQYKDAGVKKGLTADIDAYIESLGGMPDIFSKIPNDSIDDFKLAKRRGQLSPDELEMVDLILGQGDDVSSVGTQEGGEAIAAEKDKSISLVMKPYGADLKELEEAVNFLKIYEESGFLEAKYRFNLETAEQVLAGRKDQEAEVEPVAESKEELIRQNEILAKELTALSRDMSSTRGLKTTASEKAEESYRKKHKESQALLKRIREFPNAPTASDLSGTTSKLETPLGLSSEVETSRGTEVDTRFKVIEGKNLKASNNTDGTVNPEFPSELQPRDRERAGSISQVQKISSNLKPKFLGDSALASQGAPIVGKDNAVESGNGRTMAIKKAYKEGNADKYKSWIIENAAKFGLDAADFENMEEPILVRERQTELDRVQFAKEANQSDLQAMSPLETAKTDAQAIDDAMMYAFVPSESGDLLAASNRNFVTKFMTAIGGNDASSLMTANGEPNQQAQTRMQAAIFAKAFNDDRLTAMSVEDTTGEQRNILSAMNNAAPAFIEMRALSEDAANQMSGGLAGGIETSLDKEAMSALTGATELIRQARRDGQDIKELIKQQGLFGDIEPSTAALAIFISENNRSSARLSEAFKLMALEVNDELIRDRKAVGDMFGEPEPVTLSDILNRVGTKLDVSFGTDDMQPDLLNPAQNPVPEPEQPTVDNSPMEDLESLVAGNVTDTDEFDRILDEVVERLEAAGEMEKYDALLNQAADKLTELLEAETEGL